MKRLSTILALLLLSIAVLAQVPQQFTYQALICDAENEIVSNRVITLQLSIVTANDSVVYSEMHQTTTNENGVVSLAVGTGTTNDNFSQIDWSKGEYYLQTVADLGADEQQFVSGVSPLLSVPYAFYAEKAGNTTELNLTNYVKKTDLNSYAKPSALPTNISDLANDANYITMSEVPQPDMSNYYNKAEFDALLAGIRAEYSSQQGGTVNIENGAIKAGFSVAEGKQVYFSQGNLQFNAMQGTHACADGTTQQGTLRFAEHQYDMIGNNNSNISSTYSGWIDLFGWGTSGYNGKKLYMIGPDYSDYGDGSKDIAGTNYDWGMYNAISNGGNTTGMWRTLTYDEWFYLANTRANASSKKGVASVNGVSGLILLPDEWTLPEGIVFTSGMANDYGSEYYATVNSYTASEWAKMEANGAVFLPAAGWHGSSDINDVGSDGDYWSGSADGSNFSCCLQFFSSGVHICTGGDRFEGFSVRLVQDADGLPKVSISDVIVSMITTAVISCNVRTDGGNVVTERGVCWATTENPTVSDNKQVSGDGTGVFSVSITNLIEETIYYVRAYATNSNGTVYSNEISFKASDCAIKAGFSVSDDKQVYFSQGNLQYQASTNMWRFAQHQYDIIGEDNKNVSDSYSGWIDLFGWGTSGYNGITPYGTAWADCSNPIAGTNYDWGVYNKIFNAGDSAGLWRTLNAGEWFYIVFNRDNATSLRGMATINGINGLILLPDDWILPEGLTFTIGENGSYSYAQNTYSIADWAKMEANGAVFLPAAGGRDVQRNVGDVGSRGYYWSSSPAGNYDIYAVYLYFYSNVVNTNFDDLSYFGISVRLVQDVESTSSAVLPTITTEAATDIEISAAAVGGTVTNDGGASITERGVCWATTTNPTISDSKQFSRNNGTGEYTIFLGNLSAGTTYYARAYATNSVGTAYGNVVTFTTEDGNAPIIENGAIKAGFSVSADKQVYFSQGNLQYQECTDIWRFSEHQYESSRYEGWTYSFGWGTSGYNDKFPNMTSVLNADYGDGLNDIAGTNYDWGVYNKISNGGNQVGQWRTLTKDEWIYLVNERTNASSKKGVASVNGVNGLILLPDNWVLPEGVTFKSGMANSSESYATVNDYSLLEWRKMEANGAVFLLACSRGVYYSYNCTDGICPEGYYWSSSFDGEYWASSLKFLNWSVSVSRNDRGLSSSVRLVQDVESTSSAVLPTITTGEATEIAISSATVSGNVTDDGGASVTERGVCWATTENPTISDNKNFSSSNGTGEFTILLTNLSAGTTYYARAYAINSAGTAYGNMVTFTTESEGGNVTIENGAIKAGFSVAEGKQVYFSQGNLQFNAVQGTHACADGTTKQGTWRFAEHQYDTVGADNSNISETYDGWIDLFGWGTSGYNGKTPYMTSSVNSDYGDGENDIAGTNYDWGVYNAISNGGNKIGQWRTLTGDEWYYLIMERPDESNKRGGASVNGVNGLILLPDNWTMPDGLTFNSGRNSNYVLNTYSTSDWSKMEANGAVFLPAAGYRSGNDVSSVETDGDYWTSSIVSNDVAYSAGYGPTIAGAVETDYLYIGISVRLVQDVETTSSAVLPTITTGEATEVAISSATVSGNVTDDGGASVTERGVCWATTENPTISDNKNFSSSNGTGEFTILLTNLSAGTTYYARAYATNSVGTAYGNVVTFTTESEGGNVTIENGAIKAGFSVAEGKQVYFSQGNLQFNAMQGTHACADGTTKQGTWRFAEHQYDTIGDGNKNVSSTYEGWLDLFIWGTSGYNDKNPYMTSENDSDYGDGENNIAGTNYDWGVNNAISNGGNQTGQWRTLTKDEWVYLINTRTNASSKNGMASVNGVNGLILLPDNWSLPNGIVFTSGVAKDYGSEYYATVNSYTTSEWSKMEENGAVFLPAAGELLWGDMIGVGSYGSYWSSSAWDIGSAFYLIIASDHLYVDGNERHRRRSVRLVQDVESTSSAVLPTITTGEATEVAMVSAMVGGNVTSDGGAEVTERGVCWATTPNPTISDNKLVSGDGKGKFSVSLTDLSEKTTYYVRAYATNSVGTAYGNEITFMTNLVENGVIKAKFSVSAQKQVYFSQGNLQFNAMQGTHACADGTTQQGTWRFAENQYDIIGEGNTNISETYNGWIDLFGWGTSGWNSGANEYQPYDTSTSNSDYYPGGYLNYNNLTGSYANADWGVYNNISNGGNQAEQWRTLTYDEWNYVIYVRANAWNMYGIASVNGVNGLILLPDEWMLPEGIVFTSGVADDSGSEYYATVNSYTANEWSKMEANGAVFLPAAGYRNGTDVGYVGSNGCYWSSSIGADDARSLNFVSDQVNAGVGNVRFLGLSVRLVQDAE